MEREVYRKEKMEDGVQLIMMKDIIVIIFMEGRRELISGNTAAETQERPTRSGL